MEGSGEGGTSSRSAAAPEKKDFWDSFGEPVGERTATAPKKSSAIGTAAMKGGGAEKEWGEDGWDKF